MIKVNNQSVVSEVAGRTYRANRKRNLLTIFAIVLTTFLISIVFGVGISYWNTISERNLRMQGMDYDLILTEPREDQVEILRAMDQVETAGISVKCAVGTGGEGKTLEKIHFFWVDEVCWTQQCLPAFEIMEGAYPVMKNEIVLSMQLLKALGIESPQVGMEVSLDYLPLAADATQETRKESFILSGYFRDYTGRYKGFVSEEFYEGTGAKQTDLTQGTLNISLKNPLISMQDVADIRSAIGMEDRQTIMGDFNTGSDFMKIAIVLLGLLLMILASGYLFIYNTLYISVGKDIRYYGQLKTLGMTSVQLKAVVYRQALLNACIGLPLGILAGMAVGNQAIPKLLLAMNSVLEEGAISVPYSLIYGGATIFAGVTVWIGSRKPAIMAGECTPIEALNYNGGGKTKTVRKSQGGSISSMAWRNMFRDKKQAGVILTSFVVTLLVMIGVLAILRVNDTKEMQSVYWDCDIEVRNSTTLFDSLPILSKDKIEELKNTEGIKSVSVSSSTKIIVPYQEIYADYYKILYESPRINAGNYEERMKSYKENPDQQDFVTCLAGIDDEGFAYLNEKMENSLDKEKFDKGEIALAVPILEELGDVLTKGVVGKQVEFSVPLGSDATENQKLIIDAVVPSLYSPTYYWRGYTPKLIVSQKYMEQIMGAEFFVEALKVTYDEAYSKETEERVRNIFAGEDKIIYNSKLEDYQEMVVAENQIKVLGIGLAVILGFLALLNYVNMMTASVQNRAKEFATLESIGMTKEQMKKVLSLEGIGYGCISIGGALILGIPLSILIFQSINVQGITYLFPVLEMSLLFLLVLILCLIIPRVIFGITQKGTIIEQLKRGDE